MYFVDSLLRASIRSAQSRAHLKCGDPLVATMADVEGELAVGLSKKSQKPCRLPAGSRFDFETTAHRIRFNF